jgi:hypothetical protein
LAIVAATLVLADGAAAQTAAVSGRVRTEPGRGVPGAAVLLRSAADTSLVREDETDDLGRFRLPGIEPGAYTIEVIRLGFAARAIEVEVAGMNVDLDIVLEEQAIQLGGVEVEVDRQRARFETEAGATTREMTREEMKLVPGEVGVGDLDVAHDGENRGGEIGAGAFGAEAGALHGGFVDGGTGAAKEGLAKLQSHRGVVGGIELGA